MELEILTVTDVDKLAAVIYCVSKRSMKSGEARECASKHVAVGSHKTTSILTFLERQGYVKFNYSKHVYEWTGPELQTEEEARKLAKELEHLYWWYR